MIELKTIQISKFKITEYVSVEKQLLLDAKKYIERAEMYLAIEKPRHALGCLIKAARKYDKASSHMLALDGLSKALLQPMLGQLSRNIELSILNLKA